MPKPVSFFGMNFVDVFSKENLFTDDIKKSAYTANPTPRAEMQLVFVLSARNTALKKIADVELLKLGKRKIEEFDLVDDIDRLKLGIETAKQICALRAGKTVNELADEDYVIPIFYCGRHVHNTDLKKVLDNPKLQKQLGIPYYPKRLFNITAIFNPRKGQTTFNTLGQAQSFRNFIEYHSYKVIAFVTSSFHVARAARNFCLGSPQMEELIIDGELQSIEQKQVNYPGSIDDIKLYFYGVHKNEQRNGIKLDLIGEEDAMRNYSGGENPSIAKYLGNNAFFNDYDVALYKSLKRALTFSKVGEYDDSDIYEEDQICSLTRFGNY